jgi:hypothetical protein
VSCFNPLREDHALEDGNIGFAFYEGAEAMRPISILPAFMHGVCNFLKKDTIAVNGIIEYAAYSIDDAKHYRRMRASQSLCVHANNLLSHTECHADLFELSDATTAPGGMAIASVPA